jgi:transketolase
MTAHDLQMIANELRVDVLEMAYKAGGAHLAGPLSSADLFSVLYFGDILMSDRVILSCGHYAPILYASLAKLGLIKKERLATLGQIGGLPVHPEYIVGEENVSGVEVSSGPLGQGVSVSVGMALAQKLLGSKQRIYCVCSDGELQEGQVWEAINLAVRERLDNLTFLIDNNNVQIESYVEEIGGKALLASKLEAFGCHTLEIPGHDTAKIKEVLGRVSVWRGSPVAVVLKTVGGRGVSFMENNPKWHDGKLSEEQFELAKKELLQ